MVPYRKSVYLDQSTKIKDKFQQHLKLKGAVAPKAPILLGIEDTERFLLLYHSFKENRKNLLAGVNDILKAHGKPEDLNENILQILLYGDKNLPLEANELVLSLTIKYLLETKLFD